MGKQITKQAIIAAIQKQAADQKPRIGVGQIVETPRFLKVRIEKVFSSIYDAVSEGYTEPTHFSDPEYGVYGKNLGDYRMAFCAVMKRR